MGERHETLAKWKEEETRRAFFNQVRLPAIRTIDAGYFDDNFRPPKTVQVL